MLLNSIVGLYDRLRLVHYRSLFSMLKEREGSLSATEAFSADAIYLLGDPTIKQFSDFLGVSQPNATYKIANLTEKGYIVKSPSSEDRREFRLRISEKFTNYYGNGLKPISCAAERLRDKFSDSELATFEKVLTELNKSLEQEDV